MRSKPMTTKAPAERVLKDIRRATRRHFSAEDKIRIVLDGLRGDVEALRNDWRGLSERLDREAQRRTTPAEAV